MNAKVLAAGTSNDTEENPSWTAGSLPVRGITVTSSGTHVLESTASVTEPTVVLSVFGTRRSLYASRPATFSVPLTATLVVGSIASRNCFATACGSYAPARGATSGFAGCAGKSA